MLERNLTLLLVLLAAAADPGEEEKKRGGLVSRIAARATGRVVDVVDPDTVLARVDVDAFMERVDIDALLERVDINALLAHLVQERNQVGETIAKLSSRFGARSRLGMPEQSPRDRRLDVSS